MNQQLLSEYVDIERRAKALEMEKQTLRGLILQDLKEHGMEKVESEVFGTFTVCKKTSWKYSDAITKKEEALKIAKFKEQEKEIAEPIISEYLLFKGND